MCVCVCVCVRVRVRVRVYVFWLRTVLIKLEVGIAKTERGFSQSPYYSD